MRATSLTAIVACLGVSLAAPGARTQSLMQQNTEFDRQFNQQLGQLQQQNAIGQQQLWQSYLQQNGPWLREQYQAYMASGQMPVTFEQFAYYMLITANGTNVPGALDAQRGQIEGRRRANDTVREGNDNYNHGWQERTDRTDRTLGNYSPEAIQGNAPYIDPRTGGTLWLPYGQQPGQAFDYGGNSYVQDQQGTYYQWQGNGWAMMQPGQR